jgi:DNA helicase II / ATP-dependent DNA helicase PcrA
MSFFDVENLNPEQRLAVDHVDGPLLILAGAGSGKTRVLVSRVAKLLLENPENPPGICVLTFTNKSAKELKSRVKSQIGSKTNSLWAGTFHSFGLQLLRKYYKKLNINPKFHVADTSDCQSIIKDLLMNISNSGKNDFQIDKLLNIIQTYKTNPHQTIIAEEDYLSVAKILLPKYEVRKKSLGVVDFEDLLSMPLDLFSRFPDVLADVQNLFQFFMVDEFQDTNETQMKLLNLLVKEHKNLVVVGDDDQAIYGWRGARVKNILEFPQIYGSCKVIQLNRNYRSSSPILDLANDVISNNKDRHGKIMKAQAQHEHTDRPEVFVFENDEDEIEQVTKLIEEYHRQGYSYNDIAVLYRSNGQGGFLETELRQARIPYSLSGGTAFFDRKEIKDMLSYLVCLFMPKEVSLRRIVNVPPRGVGDETLNKIEEYMLSRKEEMSFIQALRLTTHMDFLSQGSRNGVKSFLDDLNLLKADFLSQEDVDWEQRLIRYFHEIGYRKYLSKFCKNDEALRRRWVSVEIFARVFKNFMAKKNEKRKGLKEFIDMMFLRDYEDNLDDDKKEQVQLMTLHAAKGLEFPVVFIIGIEEDMIPHHRLGSDISEERRLFYVGVTRAQEKLVMTHARLRKRYGKMREVLPSRFLQEVNPVFYTHHSTGYRPVCENARDQMLKNLQDKLAASMEKQRIEK